MPITVTCPECNDVFSLHYLKGDAVRFCSASCKKSAYESTKLHLRRAWHNGYTQIKSIPSQMQEALLAAIEIERILEREINRQRDRDELI